MARWRQSFVQGLGLVVLVTAGGAVVACASRHGGPSSAASARNTAQNKCARTASHAAVVPYEAVAANGKAFRVRQGSQVVLAKRGASTVAYAADEDDGTIHVVDVASMLELGTFEAGGTPAQMMMLADGRLVVTLRDRSEVKIFEPTESATGTMSARCSIETPVEPVGLAMSPDDRTVFVTSGWGHALVALDGDDFHRKAQVDLPREPRSVVVSDDGSKAYVAHAVGSAMSVVEIRDGETRVRSIALQGEDDSPSVHRSVPSPVRKKGGRPVKHAMDATLESSKKGQRSSCQGFALAKTVVPDGRILAPQVLVESGEPTERATGYGSANGQPTEIPDVAVIDQGSDSPLPASLLVRTQGMRLHADAECILPRAAAVDPARGSLFVACVGSDELVEYDGASVEPHHAELRRWRVASGPMGVAIDWAEGRAVVWSQYDRALNVIALGRGAEGETAAVHKPVMRVAMSRRPTTPQAGDIALGRKLFHASGDARISSDGRACASCHPDGRDDSITWATPDGPRQTPMLAGRIGGTAPYAWSGNGEDVRDHLSHTFERLQGQGLDGDELDALVAYITEMAPPPARTAQANLERGSQIFHSNEAACSSCHGKNGREPDGLRHDVGSRASSDTQIEFDTPSLRFVGGSGPYFHDGRFTSLRALLVASDGKMGKVSHLDPASLDALEAYVRSL